MRAKRSRGWQAQRCHVNKAQEGKQQLMQQNACEQRRKRQLEASPTSMPKYPGKWMLEPMAPREKPTASKG